ncbi:MAG: globin-coupled sensor protein [Caulobacterales bacterium]|nr:globin-coupled sensor protein [Caulobacterales bacterium]
MSEDVEIAERLSFMCLDRSAQDALKAAAPLVGQALGPSLDRFYEQVRRFPETSKFFRDEQQLNGAKSAQEGHWRQIAQAQFDGQYVEKVRRIGATHARIGLEPRWYIGGYALVLEGLIHAIVKDHGARGRGWGKSRKTGAELGAKLSAVVKAALLDMDLSISIYLEVLEGAREEADRKRLEAEHEQKLVVERTGRALVALAAGDLTGRIDAEFVGEYRRLKDDFNAAMDSLESALTEIAANATAMQAGTGEISQASDDLSRRTEQQAATLEETAAALEQITATVRRTAEGATRASAVVLSARDEAERNTEVVNQTVEAMGAIEQSASQISSIVGVIDEIAFQTNLLALNAGVEAARAGEAGRGFAVVASEVRALAQRSAEAAKEIKTIIATSSRQVSAGVELVGRTGGALETIVGRVSEISALMGEMTASAQEQAGALSQVNTAINQMDQVTQQNAAMVEQSTAATHHLRQEAQELNRQVAKFTIRDAGGSRAAEASDAGSRGTPIGQARSRISAFAMERGAERVARGGGSARTATSGPG